MIAPAAVGCKPMLARPMAPLGRGVRIVAGYGLPERFWKRSDVSKLALPVSQNCRNRPRPAGFARGGEAILDATLVTNTWEHEYVGPLMHDRIIGALELCCRLGEMLLIQTSASTGNRIRSASLATRPKTRRTVALSRRVKLGPTAFVFGTENGEYIGSFKTAWESLLLIANNHETKHAKPGARVDRVTLRQITCTGTTYVTKARAGCSLRASASASSS